MKWRMPMLSLRAWLAYMLASATVVTFLVVGTGILLVRLPQVQDRALEQAQRAAQTTAGVLERMLEGVEQQLGPMAALAQTLPVARLQTYLDALVRQDGDFDAVMLLDEDGLIRAVVLPAALGPETSSTLQGQDLSANVLFRRLREQQQNAGPVLRPVWSDSYISPVSGEVTVGVAVPAGRRVIIGELALPRLLRLVQTVVTEDVRVVVIDQRGRWLASNAPNPTAQRSDYASIPAFQELVQGRTVTHAVKILEEKWWVGGEVSERLSWLITGGVPAGWGNYNYRMTILMILLGFSSALAIVLSLAPLWAARLTRPFQQLTQRAHRVAVGDYQPLAGPGMPIREFRELEHDLDSMARSIQAREATISRSEARLLAVLESTPAVSIQWYDRSGRIVYWNQASTDMYGYTAQEAMAASIVEKPLIYTGPEQAQAFMSVIEDISRTGQPFGPAEFELRGKDGSSVIVLASTFAIPGNDGEQIYVCMDVDITQRKLAEQALLANEIKLETIFNASPSPMVVLDADRNYQFVDINEAYERLLKRAKSEIRGRNGMDIRIWQDPAMRGRFLAGLESAGMVEDLEAWLVDGRGGSLLCQIAARIVKVGGQRFAVVSLVDVTRQREMESELRDVNVELEYKVEQRTEQLTASNARLAESLQQLQLAQDQLVESEKLAALGHLVAGVAHELNTPIGNALMAVTALTDRLSEFRSGMVQGLRRSDLEDFVQTAETATDISTRNLAKAGELVSSFKQVAADQTSSQRRRFDLGEVINEVVLMTEPTLRRTPYRIETDIPAGLVLDSFPGPLGQVLGNLINNAVVHAFEGRDHGVVRIQAELAEGDRIRILVADDGCGIDDSLRKKVFEPFFTTKMGRGGTGLGLHIVHNIVTRVLGGKISLSSRTGQGATFELLLPAHAPLQHLPPDAMKTRPIPA